MSNGKSTTMQAMVSSIAIMFLCCALLLGSTLAWFEDSARGGGNIIQTGSFDMQVTVASEYQPKTGVTLFAAKSSGWTIVEKTGNPFFSAADTVIPGKSVTKYLKITNIGNMDMNFSIELEKTAPVQTLIADPAASQQAVGTAPAIESVLTITCDLVEFISADGTASVTAPKPELNPTLPYSSLGTASTLAAALEGNTDLASGRLDTECTEAVFKITITFPAVDPSMSEYYADNYSNVSTSPFDIVINSEQIEATEATAAQTTLPTSPTVPDPSALQGTSASTEISALPGTQETTAADTSSVSNPPIPENTDNTVSQNVIS